MLATVIALATLYLMALGVLYAGVRLVLTLSVPPPLYHFKEAQKEKLERMPWWLLAALIGCCAAGLLSFDLNKLTGPLTQPSLGSWIALFLYLLIFLMVVEYLQRAPRRWRLMIAVVASAICAGASVVLWFDYPNWLTGDLVSVVVVAYVLFMLQPLWSFRVMAGGGLIVAVAYDAAQTWVSGQMIAVAQHAIAVSLPGFFLVPTHLGLSAASSVGLGAGDLIFPGLLVVVAGRVAQRSGRPRILLYAVGGYAASLLLAFVVLAVTDVPLAALAFTIPGVIAGTWWAARREGVASELTQRQVPGDPDRRGGAAASPPDTAS